MKPLMSSETPLSILWTWSISWNYYGSVIKQNFDASKFALLNRLGVCAEKDGNKYQLTLQLENGTSKNNTLQL